MKAVIFDMDGVIVDSEPLHERSFREVFAEMGYGETHGIDFTAYYGKSDLVLWRDFFEKHAPRQTLEEMACAKERRFAEILNETQPIFPRVPGLLEKLTGRYRLGLASGSSHSVISAVLSLQNLRRFFPVAVSAQDVPRGKPAPDVFLRAASLLQVDPSGCWVIEDSEAGVQAALDAGMRVIGITNTLPAERLSKATRVVSHYEEIEQLLLHSSHGATKPEAQS